MKRKEMLTKPEVMLEAIERRLAAVERKKQNQIIILKAYQIETKALKQLKGLYERK